MYLVLFPAVSLTIKQKTEVDGELSQSGMAT